MTLKAFVERQSDIEHMAYIFRKSKELHKKFGIVKESIVERHLGRVSSDASDSDSSGDSSESVSVSPQRANSHHQLDELGNLVIDTI